MDPNNFLKAYMAKNIGISGKGPEIAAHVIVPITGDPNKMGLNEKIEMDIPGVASDATVQPIGIFGNPLAKDHPAQEYGFSYEGQLNPQRGMMKFVPGGIAAPGNYNLEESMNQFPDYFKHADEGNVPAFIR